MDDNELKGIGFFNIKTGKTNYAKSDAQIQAYINSSDMGINASRGQDFGWRLEPEWVKAVRAFRQNETKMSNLASKLRLEEDESPNLMQILYAIYGQQLRAARVRAEEHETPFEEKYLADIGSNPETSVVDETGELIPAPEEPAPTKPAEVSTTTITTSPPKASATAKKK